MPDTPTTDVPEFVQHWVRALLDPEILDLVRAAGGRQIELRLYANGGKVRRRPTVLVGVGQVDEVNTDGT